MQGTPKISPKKKRSHRNKQAISQPVTMTANISNDTGPVEDSPETSKSIEVLISRKRKQEEKLTKALVKENIFKTHMSEVENKLNEIQESRRKRRKKSKDGQELVPDVKSDDVTTLKVIPEGLVALDRANAAGLLKKKSSAKNKILNPASPQPKQSAVTNVNSKEDAVKYPILNNEELINRFLNVSMTNNQKGRIRQILKDLLKGTSQVLLPDVIHNKILSILKTTENLTDTELRKIRILYNMLKTAIEAEKTSITEKASSEKKKKIKKKSSDDVKVKIPKDKENKEAKEQINKVKGPKRYVVFVGNLPLDVNKEKILSHFSEFRDCIKDIRIPHRNEAKKSAIAYLELMNEPTYELALSKHHSMFGSKRINVLYTTQKNGKITKADAKSKSAKLQAMLRTGQLIGSIPLKKKRSHRRAKLKQARKAESEH